MREDVEKAITELDIGAPTQLAVPLPLPSPPESSPSSNRTTVDLRQRELPAPVLPADEESIHLPRRRSALPWVALLATAGSCGAWWLSHHRSAGSGSATTLATAASTNPQPSAPVATPAATAQVPLVVRDRDAGPDAPDASAAAASAASHPALSPSKASPSLGPTTSATHHGSPGKVGPGNVHKFPRKHHSTRHHPSQKGGA
jgi:hypothetical protein